MSRRRRGRSRCAGPPVSETQALAISARHCATCHARQPTHQGFAETPKGVALETVADLRRHAASIVAQAVQGRAMPLGNQTGMTEEERQMLGRFLAGGR